MRGDNAVLMYGNRYFRHCQL